MGLQQSARLECQPVGEHETALSWLTCALKLAIRTADPEGLPGQLCDLRAQCLSALGRQPDDPQITEPVMPAPAPASRARLGDQVRQMAGDRESTAMMPVTVAWLPAEEYAEWPARWPDLVDSRLLLDEERGGLVGHAVGLAEPTHQLGQDRARLGSQDGAGVAEVVPFTDGCLLRSR